MHLGGLGGLNHGLWGGSHASGASFLHNFTNFFAKLRQNSKLSGAVRSVSEVAVGARRYERRRATFLWHYFFGGPHLSVFVEDCSTRLSLLVVVLSN